MRPLTTTGQLLFIVPLNSVPCSIRVCFSALVASRGMAFLDSFLWFLDVQA